MDTVLMATTRTAPNLLAALTPPAPRPRLTPLELDDAITALVDRAELAPPDERARLERVRGRLELELADALAE